MDRWSWYWLMWGTLSLCSFGVAELWAFSSNRPDHKLSQHFWQLIDSLPYPSIFRVALFIGFVFLAYHLTFGPRH